MIEPVFPTMHCATSFVTYGPHNTDRDDLARLPKSMLHEYLLFALLKKNTFTCVS